MKSKPVPLVFPLQQLVIDLAQVERNHYLAAHERHENDVEHSYAVALLCWYVLEKTRAPLSLEKVMKYALIHDLVEVYAGDVNTYASAQAREQKIKDEKLARKRLSHEFKSFPGLIQAMEQYEAGNEEEALFVWTVDKLQALIHADMNDWHPFKTLGITYDMFLEKHSGQLEKASPYCNKIFFELFEYFKTTYYDGPTK